jgi:murein DD-endopeptidase MepM/ murein hydrolase activator NlpD
MRKRDRYAVQSQPKDRQKLGRSVSGISRYLTHIFVFIILLGAAILATTRLIQPQGETPESSAVQPPGFSLPGSGPAAVPGLPATQEPLVIGEFNSMNPEVILRDFVPSGSAGVNASEVLRPRELQNYTVISGDTLFGIALKFGLRPETVLWSNYTTLKDNPDMISIGQQLIIPPQDGLIIAAEQGDTIDGIARRFEVKPEVIAGDPINKLNNINQPLQLGQIIYVPGGQRETVVWQVPKPVEVRRTATGVRVYRVGRCGEVAIPRLGSGSFIYPANRQYLSGYNFSGVHPGLDFAGRMGEPIYASDAGTVIYAGYSLNSAGKPVGYGQYVVLDHGNGYVTLYAHASQLYVNCGQQVQKGAVIAAVGSVGRSTGPHLHYEIRYGNTAVNPWSLLPGR